MHRTFIGQADNQLSRQQKAPARSRVGRGAAISELRRKISMIERNASTFASANHERGVKAESSMIGRHAIDWLLSGKGLPLERPALHELVADGYGSRSAVRDFALTFVASLMHQQRRAKAAPMVLWCQRRHDDAEFGRVYGPGLLDLGLSPAQLIMVTGRRDVDCLWAMEQGLRAPNLAAVIGMVDETDMIASRRLSLAASDHGTWCLLLPLRHGRAPSAASTRWRINTSSSAPANLGETWRGRPRWQLTLERCRNGRTGYWIVEWDHATHRFHLVAPMADRPPAQGREEAPNRLAG